MSDKREPPTALGPKFEPVGPTVEHDISRLISRYGKVSVLAAVKSVTQARLGRKPEKDWLLFKPYIEADAADWLGGRDPIQLRSHYSIAQEIAKSNPGHNQTATATRLMRKLKAKRRGMSLVIAGQSSENGHPYTVHLGIMELLASEGGNEVYGKLLGFARNDVARYRARVGEPSPEMSFSEIREAAQNSLGALAGVSSFGTIGGLWAAKPKP